MRGYLRLCPLLALLVLPLGCGKHYQLAPVSGEVMLDGRPLAHAEVRFIPTSGNDLPYSMGVTNDEGHFDLHLGIDPGKAGAVVGEHHVTISLDPAHGKMIPPGRKGMPKRIGEMLPSRYNRKSELTCIVPPEGKQDANFDLKSK